MPDGDVLLLLDEEGRVAQWGRTAERMFGWSAAQALGQPVSALLHKAAMGNGSQGERIPDAAALVVRPELEGHDVVWQVFQTEDDRAPQDTSVLTAVLTHCAVEVQVFDPQLRLVRLANHSCQRAEEPGHLQGTPFTQVCGIAAGEEEIAVARRVLDSGEPAVNRLVPRAEVTARPGHPIRRVSYFRLQDPGGEVLGLVACVTDTTEQERARRSLALLESVRSHMGRRLNVMDACQELVEAVVPAFADAAVVHVVESTIRGEDAPLAPVGPGVLLCQAAARGRGAASSAAVRRLLAGTAEAHVLSDLQPRLVPVGTDSGWPGDDLGHSGAVGGSGGRSVIVAPLALGDRVLGLVRFRRHEPDDVFGQDDLAVASAISAHAALCIDRACHYMREWIIMSTIQRRLLPRQLADQPTVQVCPLHIPGAEGGGGWCDAIALPGARTALVVGDVAGQGMPAAIAMGLLRTAIHTLVGLDLQPDELLARLSDTTARLVAARAAVPPLDPLARDPLTAGCTIAIYDPVDLTCIMPAPDSRNPSRSFPTARRPRCPSPRGRHWPHRTRHPSRRPPSPCPQEARSRWAPDGSPTRSWPLQAPCGHSWRMPAPKPCPSCAMPSSRPAHTTIPGARH